MVFGLATMGLVALLYGLVIPMPSTVRAGAVVLAVLLTLWFLALPLLNARHWAAIVRRGVVVSATVTRVTYLAPRNVLGTSIQAMKNGVAYGEDLTVEGIPEPLCFESDETWAKDLVPGSRLMAVIHLNGGAFCCSQ